MRHRVVWALGDNAFLLRREIRVSGFDQIIRGLSTDGVVYAEWNAGACVTGLSHRQSQQWTTLMWPRRVME